MSELTAKNDEHLKQLDLKLQDAKDNLGSTEVYEASMELAHHHCMTGTQQQAESAYRVAYEKAVGVGARLEIVLTLIRLGFFWRD